MTLADLIRQERVRRGMTYVELGEAMGMAFNTAWRLAKGRGVPAEETLVKAAAFLHMPITEVRRAAGRAEGELEPFVLTQEANQLSERERNLVRELVWTFLDAHGPRVTRS